MRPFFPFSFFSSSSSSFFFSFSFFHIVLFLLLVVFPLLPTWIGAFTDATPCCGFSSSLFFSLSLSLFPSFYHSPPFLLSVYFFICSFLSAFLSAALSPSLSLSLSLSSLRSFSGAFPIFLAVSFASMRVSRSEGCVREYSSSGRNASVPQDDGRL